MGYFGLHYKYNCKNCRRRKYKYCDIRSEAIESAKKLVAVKQRGMLLNQTEEEYRKEVREVHKIYWEKSNKMYRCRNHRIHLYLKIYKKKRQLFIVEE